MLAACHDGTGLVDCIVWLSVWVGMHCWHEQQGVLTVCGDWLENQERNR
jgi:hypothetical protein